LDTVRANANGCRSGTDTGRLPLIYNIDLGARAADSLAQSPETPGKTGCTFVDTTPALDKITQRLIQVFEFRRVPQNTRPFAPRPVIDFFWIGRTKDHSGKRFRLSQQRESSQVQRPMSTVDCPTLLRPCHDGFENGGQILIDRIPVAAGLNRIPLILQSPQIRLQRFGRKWDGD